MLRELTVGSSLYLPVQKAGGRVWVGDVHALQGDGVVDQTAIETAAEDLQIRYVLHKGVELPGPLAETPTDWIGLGFADDLDDALVACLRELIAWLHAASGITESEAYALCSMAASFRVTQYAHQTGSAYTSIPPKTVHGLVPKTFFPRPLQEHIGPSCVPGAIVMTLSAADRLEILDVLARADWAATRRDAEAYVACSPTMPCSTGRRANTGARTSCGARSAPSGRPKVKRPSTSP